MIPVKFEDLDDLKAVLEKHNIPHNRVYRMMGMPRTTFWRKINSNAFTIGEMVQICMICQFKVV